MLSLLYHFTKLVLLLTLPFILLVRGSLLVMEQNGLPAYPSLAVGAGMTILVLFIYFSFFYGRLAGKFGSFDTVKRRALMAFLIVGIYLFHGIFLFSAANAKTSMVSEEFKELHPILRLGISTLIHFDKQLIITDAERVAGDYQSMGLSENKNSKHYRQRDGYVHAVDLRTKNRGELRNKFLSFYFKTMGFNTLRHGGTADHLHVALY